ncbi:hypothetical protein PanWU01x14_064210 [Parasponia andersonii]|uniref:Uncharacterized protein n=1 Tax=Parasponia andersonii TaxID=3476 RepID=A0A2P5DHC0_PARAD|nr:hypothetical protein PanWU01x14_064210 [Parasponia andersonii]
MNPSHGDVLGSIVVVFTVASNRERRGKMMSICDIEAFATILGLGFSHLMWGSGYGLLGLWDIACLIVKFRICRI